MTTARLPLPAKLVPVFTAKGVRYRCAHGGRGSAKTRSFALMAAVRGFQEAEAGREGIIVCAREFMNSLDDSSMEEVKAAIASVPWLAAYYEVGEKFIRTRNGRVAFKFVGLRHNLNSIKSKARILLVWVDEAEDVAEIAWRKLTPTVREAGSEIWVTWNPESDESATHKRFRATPDDDVACVEINYSDNPFFPEVMERERQRDLRIAPDTYDHVWNGAFLTRTDAQVFAGKVELKAFEPEAHWNGPYYGVDFGFAQDPTTGNEVWVGDDRVWVRREANKIGLELDDTAPFLTKRIPGIVKHTSRADSARPESISYLRRHGLPRMEAAPKWQGSVEDGVAFLKAHAAIVVHPDCPDTAREFRLYSYKVDRMSGDVMPQIVDAHNHHIDGIRYALAPLIQGKDYCPLMEADW